jgi:DHA1 family bicyclomycin/chloramphenicol resistance-like MFS transporter
VVIPGTIREYYGKDTAKGLSYVSMIMMLAPMIAPSVGSLLLLVGEWQIIFYVLAAYSIIILYLVFKYLPEVQREKTVSNKHISFLARYKIVFSNQQARLDITSSMVISLAFFAYITAIPFVYLTVYSTSELMFSILFAINVIALMSAHFINTRMVVKQGSRRMLWFGLSLALITSSLLVAVNYWQLPLAYTVIAILPLMGSISMIAVNSDALVLTQFTEQSGTATAVIGTLRFGIGALAGPILAWFYDGSALPFALLMWGAVVVVLICQVMIKIKISDV